MTIVKICEKSIKLAAFPKKLPPPPLKFSQPTSQLSKFQILVGMTWIMLAHHISVVSSCCTSLGIVLIKIIAVLRIFQFKRLSKIDNFFWMLVFKRRCEQNKFSLSIVSFVPVLYSFFSQRLKNFVVVYSILCVVLTH